MQDRGASRENDQQQKKRNKSSREPLEVDGGRRPVRYEGLRTNELAALKFGCCGNLSESQLRRRARETPYSRILRVRSA